MDCLSHKDLGVLNMHQAMLGYGSSFSVTHSISEHENIFPDIGSLVFKRTLPTSVELSAIEIQKRLRSLMLELRVLAHDPIQHHENIVDFLGIAWETDPFDLTRKWPVIIMERATYGTLSDFLNQIDSIIPFKQKVSLALDIALGLKVLHACGILHGDIKADNVLIFCNRDLESRDQRPVIARLADFSGVLFDMRDSSVVPSGTRPWNAPEWRERLPPASLLKTDVYSLGFLVYRIMADGKHPFRDFRFADDPGWSQVEMLKMYQDGMLEYMLSLSEYQGDVDIIALHAILENTIRRDPHYRDLGKVEAILQQAGPNQRKTPATFDLTPRQLQLRDQPVPFMFVGHDLLDSATATHVATALTTAASAPSSSHPSRAAEAKYGLAVLTINGLVGPSDQDARIRSGLKWLEAAGHAGSDRAQAVYARACAAFETEAPGSCTELVELWLRETASRGFFIAMEDLSEMGLHECFKKAKETLAVRYGGTGAVRFLEPKFTLDGISIDDVHGYDQRLVRDVKEVRQLKGYVPWSRAQDTVLHFAASCGLNRTLEALLENLDLADVNATNVREETPLLLACRSGHYRAAMMLQEAGADPSISNIYGETPLHWLLSFEDRYVSEVARKLLDKGAAIDAFAESFSYVHCGENTFVGGTPLMRAVTRNRLIVVKTLLLHGADPNLTYKTASAIRYAALLHYPDILTLLLARSTGSPRVIESVTGVSLLLPAVMGGSLESHGSLFGRVRRHGRYWRSRAHETLQLILDNGAAGHLHDVPGLPGSTATYVAARHAQPDILSYLLEHGAADLVNTPSAVEEAESPHLKRTPLAGAINARNLDSLELLLRHGADAKAKEHIPTIEEPVTLLYECAWTANDNPAFAQALIDHGVAVNETPKYYETPFACAVRNRCFKLAECLYRNGADLNAEFVDGLFFSRNQEMSILGHLVAECSVGTLMPLSFLFGSAGTDGPGSLQMNPDFVVAKERGMTVLHAIANNPFARQESRAEGMILERVMAFFKPTSQMLEMRFTDMEYTALHIAVMRGNARVVRGLMDAGADSNSVDVDGKTTLDLARDWLFYYPDETLAKDEEHFVLSEKSRRRLRSNREQIVKSIERRLASGSENQEMET